MMKTIYKISMFIAAAIAFSSCAKSVSVGVNEADKRYFDAWLSVNAPEAEREGRGIYVFPEYTVEGTGATVEKDGFVIWKYVIRNLDGSIISYTDKQHAEQLGSYDPASYYGVQVQTTTPETIRAGIYDAIIGMKAGGEKRFIVPEWLMSYSNFATEEEYLAQETEYSNTIYEVKVMDFAKNINDWQLGKMRECFCNPDFYDGAFADTQIKDSTSLGFYFKMLNKVESKKEFPTDTTIYINYTGRLLKLPKYYGDGLMFDTTIENLAKDNHLYSSSKTYEPVAIKWGEKHSDITLSGSNVVSGFSQTIWNMVNCAPGTKAVGVFYSDLGYGYNGNGSIPAYAPLVFEIEIVEKPE
jgi:hypothetical protein